MIRLLLKKQIYMEGGYMLDNMLFGVVLMIGGLFAQSIHGVITDVDNKPLEGANVVVVGTDLGCLLYTSPSPRDS